MATIPGLRGSQTWRDRQNQGRLGDYTGPYSPSQPGTLLRDMVAAGMKPNAASLMMAGSRDAMMRANGRSGLSNEEQIAASRAGISNRDLPRLDYRSGQWMDGGRAYQSPGDTFNYGPMASSFKVAGAKSGGTYGGDATGGPAGTSAFGEAPRGTGSIPLPRPGMAAPGAMPAAPATPVTAPSGFGTTPTLGSPVIRGGDPTAPAPISPAGAPAGSPGSPGYGVNVNDFLDPSRDFTLSEGFRGLINNAAARGSLDSGQTLRDLLRYGMGLASQDYGNAFGRATNVRDFNYGADVNDRNFAYNAQRDDRNFNYGTLRDLANWGLSAAGQSSGGENALAGILASLIGNRGQIAGTGAIGGSNAINGSISQIINMLLTNNALQNIGGR